MILLRSMQTIAWCVGEYVGVQEKRQRHREMFEISSDWPTSSGNSG